MGKGKQLAGTGHPHLAPPGWTIGRPLSEIIAHDPLTTAEATAVALAVLSALGELHRRGKAHGAVGLDSVGVGLDGWIRLAADQARSRGGEAGDLTAAGRLLCRLLEVPVEPAAGPTPAAERSAPALVAVGRRLASSRAGWSADEAWSAVRAAAGTCGTEPQLVRALAGLGERAAGRGEIQKAVTRVVMGLPLGTPGAAAPERPRRGGPRLPRLHRAMLPALSAPVGRPLAGRLRKFAELGAALIVAGALVGGFAGALSSRQTAAQAKAPVAGQPRTPSPAVAGAQSPNDAVATFFQLVQQQKLDQAAALWTPQMSSATDLASRFGGVVSIDLRQNRLLGQSTSRGTASVAVDWVETDADGTTHEYAGLVFESSSQQHWRWDSWRVQEVAQSQPAPPPPPSNGGGGGDGG